MNGTPIRTTFARALAASALLALAACGPRTTIVAKAPAPPADADGDGVPDAEDKCPAEKEDGLPPDPNDGCKTTDADGDGVPDASDKCPGEKEDGAPPDAGDGCPNQDPDGDGITGQNDKCPNEPETKNDFEDDDGCPDKPPRVQVTRTEVKINEKILFAFDKATIDAKSNDLLDNIAEVILKNPQIEFLEVAGHADHIGTDVYNVSLTRQRAQAVHAALVKRGLDGRRMRAVGYGRHCPRASGDSDEAREKNRRVEFKIVRVDGVETGVQLGCEEASSKGLRPAPIPAVVTTREQNESSQGAALEKLAAYRASRPPPPPEAAKPDDKGGKPGDPKGDQKGGKPDAKGGKGGDQKGDQKGGKPGDPKGDQKGGKPGDPKGGKPGDPKGGKPDAKPGKPDAKGGKK
ncbi:MAG TPA: OmpA family protein [Polyangiaceae bacterium]|nr:OmpA family protein [Polyangiaceae bacterium]